MKTGNIISKILTGGLIAAYTVIFPASAKNPIETAFLQDIQSRLTKASGIGHDITVYITTNEKHVMSTTPTSIHFSYKLLKHMKTLNQLVATMAHMTAHIGLDNFSTPPLPEGERSDQERPSSGDYLKSIIRPEYPDETNVPQATGSFHDKGPGSSLGISERPGYQNKNYDYAVNKTDIIKAEHELDADKVTGHILGRAGFCPSDYNRMLRYFYENPQGLLSNRHFALDADQWQRLDLLDRTVDPAVPCTDAQTALIQKYSGAFDRLKTALAQTEKTRNHK
ncbi:hypothetical protein MNBD_ALPHA03-2151 [hydrothermal vent metagenome]|uniref:Uncharacterized protein n=1 Tax=hydrothermal vent metagenome TaxID=652676 RepID=A0A3B1B4Q3_9ZZZZ